MNNKLNTKSQYRGSHDSAIITMGAMCKIHDCSFFYAGVKTDWDDSSTVKSRADES